MLSGLALSFREASALQVLTLSCHRLYAFVAFEP
jgi:hypothetical protein